MIKSYLFWCALILGTCSLISSGPMWLSMICFGTVGIYIGIYMRGAAERQRLEDTLRRKLEGDPEDLAKKITDAEEDKE